MKQRFTKKNKYKQYNRKTKQRNIKQKRHTFRKRNKKQKMKRVMKGGSNMFNLSVDENNRFVIIPRTNENIAKGYSDKFISQKRFLIVVDNMTHKQYIIDADTNDYLYLFLFESAILPPPPPSFARTLPPPAPTAAFETEQINNKVYVYYIDYYKKQVEPLRTTEYIEKQMEIINDMELDLDEKIERITDDGYDFCINLTGYDYNEVKYDYNINIDDANLKLNQLNQYLQTKCPSLELKLNYLIDLPGTGIVSTFYIANLLTLCLYNQGNCISSIMCKLTYFYEDFEIIDEHEKPNPNAFEISSETNPSMERRKFNKLLRAVLIIISSDIKVSKNIQMSYSPTRSLPKQEFPIKYILSQAINPISAWLSINYYNAEILERGFIEYIQDREREKNEKINITYNLIKDYMKDKHDVNTKIDLNSENINKAISEFQSIILKQDGINCQGIEDAWTKRESILLKNSEDDYDYM